MERSASIRNICVWMNWPGPPGGSCVNLSAGPSVSDIISKGALQPLLKKLQPRVHPTSRRSESGPCRKTTVRFLFFSFHLSTACFILLARSFLFISVREILIYPWTRHILYLLSSQGRATDIYQPVSDITFVRRNYIPRNCLFDIPTGIFCAHN